MEASNIKPVTILSSYLCLAAVLTAQILWVLYQATTRPPTQRQDTHYEPPNSAHLILFATLAVVSLAITWYYMLAFFTLSYQTWARNNNVPLPAKLDVLLARKEDHGGLHLGAWLRDTKLFKDAWETVIYGSAKFWWSQQIFLITAIWGVFLGVEGNYRRKIPHLWTFMLLGQIVAISFAMNLSFLAMLLWDPEAGGKMRVQNEQGEGYPARTLYIFFSTYNLYIASLGAVFASIFYIPSFVGTSSFLPLLVMLHVLLFLPVIIPQHWRQTDLTLDGQPQTTNGMMTLYRLTVGSSIILFVRATYLALRDQESGGALAIFNELRSHPAVSSVGWDVNLCFLSAAVWASIDGRSSRWMLKYIPYFLLKCAIRKIRNRKTWVIFGKINDRSALLYYPRRVLKPSTIEG